jgi:hypothetical protein
MPKILKTKADRKADKKALKISMKKRINKVNRIMDEFWFNEGWMALEDYRKLTFSLRILKNRMDAVSSMEKWISDEDFAALNKPTELEAEVGVVDDA